MIQDYFDGFTNFLSLFFFGFYYDKEHICYVDHLTHSNTNILSIRLSTCVVNVTRSRNESSLKQQSMVAVGVLKTFLCVCFILSLSPYFSFSAVTASIPYLIHVLETYIVLRDIEQSMLNEFMKLVKNFICSYSLIFMEYTSHTMKITHLLDPFYK